MMDFSHIDFDTILKYGKDVHWHITTLINEGVITESYYVEYPARIYLMYKIRNEIIHIHHYGKHTGKWDHVVLLGEELKAAKNLMKNKRKANDKKETLDSVDLGKYQITFDDGQISFKESGGV